MASAPNVQGVPFNGDVRKRLFEYEREGYKWKREGIGEDHPHMEHLRRRFQYGLSVLLQASASDKDAYFAEIFNPLLPSRATLLNTIYGVDTRDVASVMGVGRVETPEADLLIDRMIQNNHAALHLHLDPARRRLDMQQRRQVLQTYESTLYNAVAPQDESFLRGRIRDNARELLKDSDFHVLFDYVSENRAARTLFGTQPTAAEAFEKLYGIDRRRTASVQALFTKATLLMQPPITTYFLPGHLPVILHTDLPLRKGSAEELKAEISNARASAVEGAKRLLEEIIEVNDRPLLQGAMRA